MMNLEDRLRAELDRSGRSTKVGQAPAIDELASVADGRRQRNRRYGIGGAALLGGAVVFGAFLSTVDNTSTVELANDAPAAEDAVEGQADGTESLEQAQEAPSEELPADEASGAETGEVATATAAEPDDDAVSKDELAMSNDDARSAANADTAAAPAADVATFAAGAAQLQPDEGALTVQKRESAVGLSSGSGVLIQSDGAGGYVGIAVAFGESTTPVSLSSPNGLDWTGIAPFGIPDGATASVLRQYNGSFVALFERFDAASGIKQFMIGTSPDTVAWDVSAPLPGGEIFATDMAVGPAGVIVIGDNQAPLVWSGPLGGPYTRTGRLDARALSGVTTVGNQFVVAGRSDDGSAIFTSTDAATWNTTALGTGAGPALSVSDGTVMMRSLDDSVTLISGDAGSTWSALPASTGRGVMVSNTTMGFLGGDAGGAVVAIADDDSFLTVDLNVSAPDRLALVAAGTDELVMVQTTEAGTTWIVAQR